MVYLDQLPVGSLAQLIERCTGVAEVMDGFKSRAGLNFFSGLISTTSAVVFIAARIVYIRFFTALNKYDFSYIYSH